MNGQRLNLTAIESSLRAVQADFDRINRDLSQPRDPMTDEVRENMVSGYRYIDDALAQGTDFFSLGNSRGLLELNIMVLSGESKVRRKQFQQHITATEQRFYGEEGSGIGALMEWLARNRNDNIWKRAAGVYIHILSRPQLYIEGNHRTGALIMAYMLAREGKPPFVLSIENAKAYFEPSSLAQVTSKHSLSMLVRLPKLRKGLAKLLKRSADKRYLIQSVEMENTATPDLVSPQVKT
jgi:hypothetical protein